MKCLDVGCAGGHVALLISSIAGPEGEVIGTEIDEEILAPRVFQVSGKRAV